MAWFSEVEAETRNFRIRRAALHTAKAQTAKKQAQRYKRACEVLQMTERARTDLAREATRLEDSAKWHEGRAKGQEARFSTVHACGERGGEVSCTACGTVKPFSVACGVWRLCISCRAHAALERRARFGRARAFVLL